VSFDQSPQRCAALQATTGVVQRHSHAAPRFTLRIWNWSRIAIRPVAVFTLEGSRPVQDLGLRKGLEADAAAHSPVFGQEPGQRRPRRQAALTLHKRIVYSIPCLGSRPFDRARSQFRPLARLIVILVAPGQHLLDGQWRAAHIPMHAPMTGQQLRQRRAAQSSPPFAQCLVDGVPGIAVRTRNDAALAGRPVSCPAFVIVGPTENLPNCQPRTCHVVFGAASCRHEAGERIAARQPSLAVAERHVHRVPRLTVGAFNRTIAVSRPVSGLSMVGVSPLQDLGNRVLGECLAIAFAAVLCKQSGQRSQSPGTSR
jgi:hypothetical protein